METSLDLVPLKQLKPLKPQKWKKLLTDKQIIVRDSDIKLQRRVTLLEGAIRTGKTRILIWLWISHVYSLVKKYKLKNKKFIMTGYTIPSLKKNVLDDMTELFGIDTTLDENNQFKMFGNTICCFGADKSHSYKSMRGITAYGWLGNEMTLQHINTYREAFDRCSGIGARIFLDTNPDAPTHHVKRELIDIENEDIISHHFRIDDNTFLDPKYVKHLKDHTPSGFWYSRNIDGEWVAAEGVIYRDFAPHHIVNYRPEAKDIVRTFLGLDWGYEHAGSILLIHLLANGVYFVEAEWYGAHKSLDYWMSTAASINLRYPGEDIDVFCDSARPDLIQMIRDDYGVNAKEANKRVMEGIMYVAMLFKLDRLLIHASCVNLIGELQSYGWSSEQALEPLKENDDSVDALRYGLFTAKGAIEADLW